LIGGKSRRFLGIKRAGGVAEECYGTKTDKKNIGPQSDVPLKAEHQN
jgi:hypothetical protein